MYKETVLHLDEEDYPTQWHVVQEDHIYPSANLTLQSNVMEPNTSVPFCYRVNLYNRGTIEQPRFTFEYLRIVVEGDPAEYISRVEFTNAWCGREAPQFYPDMNQFIPLLLKGANPDDHQSSVP